MNGQPEQEQVPINPIEVLDININDVIYADLSIWTPVHSSLKEQRLALNIPLHVTGKIYRFEKNLGNKAILEEDLEKKIKTLIGTADIAVREINDGKTYFPSRFYSRTPGIEEVSNG